jgi:DNA polymerase-3 subunit alpha
VIEKKYKISIIFFGLWFISYVYEDSMYVPLHWHSTFSFLEALWQPKDIIKRAKDLWLPAIAITDYNGMFWIPAFFLAAKDSKDEESGFPGVKAIFWLEIWFVMDINSSLSEKNIWNICLLAENEKWYHNMMELVAYANQIWFSNWIPKLDLNILKEKSEWIRVFTWGELCWITKMLSNWESESKIREVYDMLKDIFWDKCYLEITAQDENKLPLIKSCNHYIYDLAKQTNTKLIVDNDYRYLREWDKNSWLVALSVKDWTKIYDANRRNPEWKYHIMNWEEIKMICINNWYSEDDVDLWIKTNWEIADQLNVALLFNQKLFPKYEIQGNIQKLYDKYWPTSIGN